MGDWQAVETYVILRQAQDERDPPSTLETPSKQRNRSPTKTDDYYTATTNREIYQKISTDYQEIVKQTNAIREGKPLRLRLKYGCCMKRVLVHDSVTAVGHSGPFPPDRACPRTSLNRRSTMGLLPSWTPRFRTLYGGEAENYTDAQKRQAIQKGSLRISITGPSSI